MRTVEEIKDLKKELFESTFSKSHQNNDFVDSFYNQTFSMGNVPKSVEEYRPPSARRHVNSAVNHIMILGQNVIVPLWSEDKRAKELASKYMQFGRAFLPLLDKKYKNFRRNNIKNGIKYGAYVVKGPLYIPRLKEDVKDNEWDKYLESTFPFFFRSCHPNNVVWVEGDCVIEQFSRKVFDIKKNWAFKTDKSDYTDVVWYEYWTPEHRVYMADDEVVLDEENEYKFIPYDIGYAGFGDESADGKPEDLIVSMIAPNLSSYKGEARSTTAMLSGFQFNMWSRPVVDRPLEEGEKIATEPGDLTIMGRDANLRHFGPESLSPDAYRIQSIFQRDQEGVVPAVLSGAALPYESGYGQSSRMDYAKVSLLTALIGDWESTASTILDKVLYLTKNVVKEPIGILGDFSKEKAMVTIKPEVINTNLHHFIIKLDADTPEQKEHRWRLGMDSWVTGSISLETLHTDFYGIDYVTENERMLIEKALRHPAIMQVLTQEAMKDVGMRDLLGMIQEGKFNQPRKPLHGIGGEMNENMRGELPGMSNQMKAEEFR